MKRHCLHCGHLISVAPIGLDSPYKCVYCKNMLAPVYPDASLVACRCGLRKVVDLKHAGRMVNCPDCRRSLLVESYKRKSVPSTAAGCKALSPTASPAAWDSTQDRRSSSRYALRNLSVYLGYVTGSLPIRNISIQGFCLDTEHSETEFFSGQELTFDVLFNGNVVLPDARGRIVRADFLSAGLRFAIEQKKQVEQLRRLIRDSMALGTSSTRVRDMG